MAMSMMGMGGGDEPDPGMASSPENEAPETLDEESQAAVEAFPELSGDPTRIEALKTFVRLCAEKAMGGGYGGEEKKSPAKGGTDIALVFGGGAPKKGK